MVCVLATPVATLPKLALAGVIVNPGCNPLPLTAITALFPCEVETVIFPVTFSDALGLNETVNVALCPAAKVSGVPIPLAAKSFWASRERAATSLSERERAWAIHRRPSSATSALMS